MQYFIVDAFTSEPFKGNPASVVILEHGLSDERMQAIAAEFNLAETAFLQKIQPNNWHLRWFTPTVEMALCGHATLASAYVLWKELDAAQSTLRFETLSGELTANLNDGLIELNFPAIAYRNSNLDPTLLDTLKLDPVAIVETDNDLFVELADESLVRHYQPDFSVISQLSQRSLTITAQADDKNIDFVSRMFGPKIGIPEDSVTGVIHCTLVSYWGEKLGKQSLLAYQASQRGGYLKLSLQGDRVILGGKAIRTMTGAITI
jgi:PhzF family phenazine biosynthesis protein